MSVDIVMPRLSDSMEEGIIIEWLVEDGSTVNVGDEIVEIETDKASMPYEADVSGVIHFILKEGESCAVGEKIAWVGSEGEEEATAPEDTDKNVEESVDSNDEAEAEVKSKDESSETEVEKDIKPEPELVESEKDTKTRIKASPLAKRIAEDKGVFLEEIKGTGPHGRIVKKDVESIDEEKPSQTNELVSSEDNDEVQSLSSIQKTIAKRMTVAKSSVPHFYLETSVCMDNLIRARSSLKALAEKSGKKAPSYNDIIVKACAYALQQHPKANSSYNDDTFIIHNEINIGIAVATEDSLIVPVIKSADKKGIQSIGRTSKELASRVRDNKVTPEDLRGATFTVSNLGMYGVSAFQAIVNPPQAAILAVGAIEPKVVFEEGIPVEKNYLALNLSCDHRVLYGADAAIFLQTIRTALEEPLTLSL